MELKDDPILLKHTQQFKEIMEDKLPDFLSFSLPEKFRSFIFSNPVFKSGEYDMFKRKPKDLPDLIFGIDLSEKYTPEVADKLKVVGFALTDMVADTSIEHIRRHGALLEYEISSALIDVFNKAFGINYDGLSLYKGMFNLSKESTGHYSLRRKMIKEGFKNQTLQNLSKNSNKNLRHNFSYGFYCYSDASSPEKVEEYLDSLFVEKRQVSEEKKESDFGSVALRRFKNREVLALKNEYLQKFYMTEIRLFPLNSFIKNIELNGLSHLKDDQDKMLEVFCIKGVPKHMEFYSHPSLVREIMKLYDINRNVIRSIDRFYDR